MKDLRILVTGVAGDIGFAIGKILRNQYPNSFLLGVDIDSNNNSLMIYDQFKRVNLADSDSYKQSVINLVKSMRIDFIIPTSEAEINVFWKKKLVNFFENINVEVLILDQNIIDTSLDKFKTYEFLKNNKLEYPNTYLASNFDNQEDFPMIFKLRSGQGSKGLRILNSNRDIKASEMNDSNIIQELLSDDENEYTCCVFSDGELYRSIILRRKLKGGYTDSGLVVENENIDFYIVKISKLLKLVGSINLQLRLTNRGPVLFEINPRFSSTVGLRDALGFRDLLWSIQLKLEGKVEKYTKPNQGTKFFRGEDDFVMNE